MLRCTPSFGLDTNYIAATFPESRTLFKALQQLQHPARNMPSPNPAWFLAVSKLSHAPFGLPANVPNAPWHGRNGYFPAPSHASLQRCSFMTFRTAACTVLAACGTFQMPRGRVTMATFQPQATPACSGCSFNAVSKMPHAITPNPPLQGHNGYFPAACTWLPLTSKYRMLQEPNLPNVGSPAKTSRTCFMLLFHPKAQVCFPKPKVCRVKGNQKMGFPFQPQCQEFSCTVPTMLQIIKRPPKTF